jgi:hypothetical protein
MSNIAKIERLMDDLAQADWVRPYIAREIINKQARSLIGLTVALKRAVNPTEDYVQLQEARISTRLQLIAWAGAFLTPRVSTTGADIVAFNSRVPAVRQREITAEDIAETMEEDECDESEAREILAAEIVQRQRDAEMFAAAVKRDEAELAAQIDQALANRVYDDFEISNVDAHYLAALIHDLCHKHQLNTSVRKRSERNPLRVASMRGDIHVLKKIRQLAIDLADSLDLENTGISDRAPVEEALAKTAAAA